MATAPKRNLGKMPCPHCGGAVAVYQSVPGTLSYKCQEAECEASAFAAPHTGAGKKWLAALGPVAVVPVAVAPAARKAAAAVPVQMKSGFSMGGL